MKERGVFWLFYLAIVAVAVSPALGSLADKRLLGAKECTWGPSYWCANLTNAKNCGAVKHCIQTVWEHQKLPPDNSSVCQICLDMVKQARDQLESNETQEELREVFEGSCKLIPVKVITNECIKLSDEFIPELVETLASQMNPQVVCAVAGLCNNARVHKLIAQADVKYVPRDGNVQDCENCNQIAKQMEQKFRATSRDDILQNMIEACGSLGTFSDGCSAIVITHFQSLYDHLLVNLEAGGLCHLSGMCQYKFHSHSKPKGIEVIPMGNSGMVRQNEGEDLPCELCEQLVVHLRDMLVANTTEQEFEIVLKGICKQFDSFRTQCLTIVDEYYPVIYDFLANSLRPKELCSMVGVCPRPGHKRGPVWPLVPQETAKLYETNRLLANDREYIPTMKSHPRLIGNDELNSYKGYPKIRLGKYGLGVRVQQPTTTVPAPLPLERMMPQTVNYVANKEVCALCEYVLHYLQLAITAPAAEEEIKEAIEHVCERLPSTIGPECKEFVETYGNAVFALLAQEIDPSVVCPKLAFCPSERVFLDLTHTVQDKPTCPLCLFAVEELVTKLKDNKTEEEIKQALNNLCNDLPQSLRGECRTFVEDYSEQLVDMLVADFTPQEVCTYLKLCDPSIGAPEVEILSNEIPQEDHLPTTTGVDSKDSGTCVLCEFVLSKIDAALKDHATEEEIKHVVHSVCGYMPKTVVKECNAFVDQYADLVITLLAQSIDPKQICTEISLCHDKVRLNAIQESLEECAVCDAILKGLEDLLSNPAIEDDAAHALQKVCGILPARDVDQCKSLVKVYGPSILNLIARNTEPHVICEEIGLCLRGRQIVRLSSGDRKLGTKRCTWGPGYWCQTEETAKECGTTIHCQEKVWMGEKPSAK